MVPVPAFMLLLGGVDIVPKGAPVFAPGAQFWLAPFGMQNGFCTE
jgi:hypothetical protein